MNDKEKAKDFFAFSSREQSGFVVLFSIIFLLIAFYARQKYLYKPEAYDFSPFQEEIDAFYAQEQADSIGFLDGNSLAGNSKYHKKRKDNSKNKIAYFFFDPNTITQTQWEKLGLSTKQAASIIKYRNKGGKFKTKADVKKMYTISDKKYLELSPWITLPEKNKNPPLEETGIGESTPSFVEKTKENNDNSINSLPTKKRNNIPPKSINLNTADTTTLKTIRGVGSYYARKIVEYRKQLGGYVSLEQLNEIWNMRSETIQAIEPFVYIDQNDVQKIAINTIDIDSLKKHPYVSWKIARAIINYRKQHGKYQTKEDLLKIVILDEKDYLNLEPYIRTE